MDLKKARNALLAIAGLGALGACILACTSFSPDDKRILYSTFDPKTRAMGVAVYDRASAKSELVFVSGERSGEEAENDPILLRSQWLPDGKHIVVTWMPPEGSKEDEKKSGTSFAVISLDGKEPLRLFHLKGVGGDGAAALPLPIVGSRVFVNGISNRVISLDLISGETTVRTNPQEMAVYAMPKGDRVAFLAKTGTEKTECGALNPDTFAREWQVELEDGADDFRSFAFSVQGRKAVFVPDKSGEPVLLLYEEGKPSKRLSAPSAQGEDIELGQVAFSVDGKVVLAAFLLEAEGKEGKSLGILELPLDGAPPTRTILIPNADLENDSTLSLFQFGLSHDGKALAGSTAYVAAGNPELRHEECALFIVDLTDSKRKMKKVQIPFPVGLGKIGQ